jgi:hypothetical protein
MTNHPASKLIRESIQVNPYADILDGIQNFNLRISYHYHSLYLDQLISWLAIFALGWIAWIMAKYLVKNLMGGEL